MREIGSPDHASTEQLSALLDDRAEPGERWFLTEHVGECEVCASELDGLRSVQTLLRALPVHLPPRSFTIPQPVEQAQPRYRRLAPLTRVFAAIAAVLCVVFFSADAVLLGQSSPIQVQEAAGAMQIITTSAKVNNDAPVARSAAESAKPASAADARSEFPAPALAAPAAPAKPAEAAKPAAAVAAKPADAAKPAEAARPAAPAAAVPPPPPAAGAAAPQPAAAARPREEAPPIVATLGPLGTVAPYQATQPPALATMPPVATSLAVAPPQQAPAGSGSGIAPVSPLEPPAMPVRISGIEVTVLRVGGLVLGLVAVTLLVWSVILSRAARAR